ncbi:restriction endonuclease subunit S [uncultured Catenibacterium sp.]|uniref:restriction endonuclease subunit S n=1 Tax=uncultured Catenibacterium sp. TaxID=286142 RepID=UPI0025DDA248|nr:restriction endonuclease subunit S [uncultured Catenibacterium sp.]
MRVRLGDYIKEYSVKNKNDEDIPVYSVSNSLGFCKDYFGKEVASKNKTTYKIVPRGCFAYNPSRINVGSVDWQNEEERVIVSPLYNVFSVSPLLDQQYLLYYLKSNVSLARIKAVASGSVRDNLKLSMLYEFPIDLISLEQQYEVVSILNAVQKIIDLYQKELSGLDELVRARFVEMFGDLRINDKGWKYYKLDELTELITDGEHATPKRTTQGIYLLSARNVLNHQLSLEDVDFIDCDEFNRISRRIIPKEGDVLISCSGSIGRCCIVPKNIKFQMVRSIALLRFKSDINPVFAEYMITSDYLQDQINKSKTASSQANLFQGKIKSLKGVVPPLELQNQFASFVEEIDKSRSRIQKSLEASKELFDSLMQEYFG